MKLDMFNNLSNNKKENNVIQNFIKELSNHLENLTKKQVDNKNDNILQQEDCLYQVVEIKSDGAYLQNVDNNKVSKEMNINKEMLDKIGEDSVLRYKNGEYIYEEELTEEFLNRLVDIKKLQEVKEKFAEEIENLEITPETKFEIEECEEDYYILSYGDNEKNKIKVPKELIPFWTKKEEKLYFENGKFNRDI